MSSVVAPVRGLVLKALRAKSGEQAVQRLLKVVFWVALLLPLVLIPSYYFVYTLA